MPLVSKNLTSKFDILAQFVKVLFFTKNLRDQHDIHNETDRPRLSTALCVWGGLGATKNAVVLSRHRPYLAAVSL